MMRVRLASLALAAVLAGLAASGRPPAHAQEPEVERAAALLQLASILGEAHAVRVLCNGDEDQYWRRYMMDLLDIEARDSGLRSQLVSSFNRGYRAQAARDRCTPALVDVEAEIASRGRALAEAISRTYIE